MYRLLSNPIERNGQRVLTTAQLAEAYGTDSKVISYNFNHNKKHYIEGKHYFCLTGDDLKRFKKTNREFHEQFKQAPSLYLWTEEGALLHAKSLNTDKAWEAYNYLIEHYFRSREMLAYYNNAIIQILDKLEKTEMRQEKLEKEQYKLQQYMKKELVHIKKDFKIMLNQSLSENNKIMIPVFTSIHNSMEKVKDEISRITKNIVSYYFYK